MLYFVYIYGTMCVFVQARRWSQIRSLVPVHGCFECSPKNVTILSSNKRDDHKSTYTTGPSIKTPPVRVVDSQGRSNYGPVKSTNHHPDMENRTEICFASLLASVCNVVVVEDLTSSSCAIIWPVITKRQNREFTGR